MSNVTVALADAVLEAQLLLAKLRGLTQLLEPLKDSRQPGLAFVPRTTREAAGRAYVADRHAQLAARAAGYPETLGNTHAPGNSASWMLQSEIEAALGHIRLQILHAHRVQGTCAIPRSVYGRRNPEHPHGQISREALFTVLADLVAGIPTVKLARAINRDLQHFVDAASRVVDGDDRLELGACPFCANPTLVTYKNAGITKCERPKGVRCRCNDPLCGCRLDPTGYVHTWYRAGQPPERPRRPGDSDSWNTLAARIGIQHLARKKDRP